LLNDLKAYQLAIEFHKICKRLEVSYYIRDQLLRASSSITLNLAEGSGKFGQKDQKKFYGYALGSLREVQAIFALEDLENTDTAKALDKLGGYVYKLALPKTEDRKRD
jgi:four helix bundle protein